ncbi:MAG: redoxin domain-containing protein [Verrucomicrobia bacterium]|nr:redoxin domain-containing protein [Verrucomicrobiota bacterium]MDA1069661.1 redoxin domain-containing protein [Verrucomicrobiota bacterium]
MKNLILNFISILLVTVLLVGTLSAREVPNFNLLDVHEKNYELFGAEGKAVALFFTGTGCPIAQKTVGKFRALEQEYAAQGVNFWIVNSYADESAKDIQNDIRKYKLREMTYLLDSKQTVAYAYGVNRTAEVVLIDTFSWEVVYEGALDDQLSEGAEKPKATKQYLKTAINQLLGGEPISQPKTRSVGCIISYPHVSSSEEVPDYVSQVAPILKKNCVECHQPGAIGPWSMTSHRRVSNYSSMIEEVLLTRRMPPWDPHPNYGDFRDDQSLTQEEEHTLLSWIKAGSPKGEGTDPLAEPLPKLPEWRLGKPDAVLKLPEEQKIPATGVVDYRYLEVDNPFDEDVWINGFDLNPGNHSVLHHIILYVRWPGMPNSGSRKGQFFYGWAPGATPQKYDEGVAKLLPANAKLTLELHYTTSGEEETDLTEMAIYLADGPQERIGETRSAINSDLDIPPGEKDARHVATYAFKKPATIYGLFPHMHFRGTWMRYELLTPDGKKKTLLHVPRYDFQWQLSYYPKEPIRVPAGSWLLVTGAFDNSVKNPNNPDPTRRVVFGEQSWDEMFIGFFEAADDPDPSVAMLK